MACKGGENFLESLREELEAVDCLKASGISNPFELDASNVRRDSHDGVNKPHVLEANKETRKKLIEYDSGNLSKADASLSVHNSSQMIAETEKVKTY